MVVLRFFDINICFGLITCPLFNCGPKKLILKIKVGAKTGPKLDSRQVLRPKWDSKQVIGQKKKIVMAEINLPH